ncbi:porin [Paraburkholderia rhizosphaerae]|uniref:Putative porin n=1 Tax=Paraburkholderia rhizosphaerae TaxID=480658 RepID=A0A4R8M066_9BURK|nr:porin [Paraburkholderia rhizosphaerae]TDY52732.1 putative porin [Paraburkholderia rhizosphaerae]
MKKKALFAMLSIWSLSSHAQSSVTLYGLIDEGFEAASNTAVPGSRSGARLFRLDSTFGLNSSRWGLRGTEDLGGGLHSLFVLESGFELNTGKLQQGGAEFGRQAYVGISSDRFGTVTLGRQYDSVVDFIGRFEFGTSNVGTLHAAHPADLDNINDTRRTNNAIKFHSASLSGFSFEGLYSFGGVPGSSGTNSEFSLAAGYTGGPIDLGIAYLNAKNPAASLFGSNPTDTAASNGLTATPILSGYATANSYQVVAAGGAYKLGRWQFGSTYSNIRFGGIGALEQATAVFNDVEGSVQYQFTPQLRAGVAYNYLHGSEVNATVGGATYNQVSAGADYALSGRTDIYVAALYQTAHGDDSTGRGAVANLNGISASSNRYQSLVRVGLRHRF